MKKLVVACSVAALAAGGGVAYAAIPDSGTGVYTACVANNPGFFTDHRTVYIIDKQAGDTCNNGYTEKTWNQTGPQGAQGTQGPAGPQGEPGADAGAIYTHVITGGVVEVGTPKETREAFCPNGDTFVNGDVLVHSWNRDPNVQPPEDGIYPMDEPSRLVAISHTNSTSGLYLVQHPQWPEFWGVQLDPEIHYQTYEIALKCQPVN